jgi:hypothetical protein
VAGAPNKLHESAFESCGARDIFERGQGVANKQASGVDNRDAIGEQLDLGMICVHASVPRVRATVRFRAAAGLFRETSKSSQRMLTYRGRD